MRILSFLVACTFIADARAGRRSNFGGGELLQGPLGTRFKESMALWPRTCLPHSSLHGNDEREERRMRVHAIRSSIRLPSAAGDKRSRVKLHAAIERSRTKRLYSPPPPASEGNGNGVARSCERPRLPERRCDTRARLHARGVGIDPLEGRKGHIEFSPPAADLHRKRARSPRAAGGSEKRDASQTEQRLRRVLKLNSKAPLAKYRPPAPFLHHCHRRP